MVAVRNKRCCKPPLSGTAAHSRHSWCRCCRSHFGCKPWRWTLFVFRVADGRCRGDGAVAALRCLEQLHIVTTRGVRAVVPLVLGCAVALNSLCLRVVDGQMRVTVLSQPSVVWTAAYSRHFWCTCCRSIGTWLQAVALNSLVLGWLMVRCRVTVLSQPPWWQNRHIHPSWDDLLPYQKKESQLIKVAVSRR